MSNYEDVMGVEAYSCCADRVPTNYWVGPRAALKVKAFKGLVYLFIYLFITVN